MTVIAAMAHRGRVYMAADTGSQVDGTVYHNDEKLFTLPIELDGHVACEAHAHGLVAVLSAPQVGDDLVNWGAAISEAICGIVTDARPAPLDEAGWIAGLGLMGFRGQVWLLSHQCAAPLKLPYSAIGSGADLALGVLHTRRDCEDPRAALDEAVHTACIFDSGCTVLAAGPCHLVV